MKLDRLVGERFKERPSDCVIDSHALMIRGGYMKQVSNGIYSQFMPLKRIAHKVERIIREEMDAIDGQEVLFPVVMPASLWEESGRYESVGKELAKFVDRNEKKLILGMTHEEACVHLVKEYGNSYTKYPFMVYQIQTKFRDEARPRAGLIRVREFTMKDAYSFHTSQEDLEEYYERCYEAYLRIFARAGIPDVVAVSSDPGMMGGNISHEFMLLTPVGEDTVVLCTECDYKANMEAAESIVENTRDEVSKELELVSTPATKTIEALCDFLGITKEKTCKAVMYRRNIDDKIIVVFIRGDLDVNETKVRNYLGFEIHPADIEEGEGIVPGFTGPVNLSGEIIVLFDKSLENTNNMVTGGNVEDYHYVGLDFARDLKDVEFHDFAKAVEGGICPQCGNKSLTVKRGIEVGNIFQLGTKYTESMGMEYIDSDGKPRNPIMGCYGIGVGRLIASVAEVHHDENGPIWPMSISPWQVHICALRSDEPNVKEFADKLYENLMKKGIEVIYDDRNVSAGVMFSDADLLGVPVRVIVSPRNLKNNVCEITARDKSFTIQEPIESVEEKLVEIVKSNLC